MVEDARDRSSRRNSKLVIPTKAADISRWACKKVCQHKATDRNDHDHRLVVFANLFTKKEAVAYIHWHHLSSLNAIRSRLNSCRVNSYRAGHAPPQSRTLARNLSSSMISARGRSVSQQGLGTFAYTCIIIMQLDVQKIAENRSTRHENPDFGSDC
eukprot:COSAG02_NODE_3850_length_6147_cov_7.419478_11_plen_156_part_00